MTQEEFIEQCRILNWESLALLLGSGLKDLSYKIFVTALIQVYHPDEAFRKPRSLSIWDKSLSNIPVPVTMTMMANSVDVGDFYHAFYFAKIFENTAIDPKPIEDAIRTYVQKNKCALGESLTTHPVCFQRGVAKHIEETFGSLEVTPREKEEFNAQQTALEEDFDFGARLEINAIKALRMVDSRKSFIDKLFSPYKRIMKAPDVVLAEKIASMKYQLIDYDLLVRSIEDYDQSLNKEINDFKKWFHDVKSSIYHYETSFWVQSESDFLKLMCKMQNGRSLIKFLTEIKCALESASSAEKELILNAAVYHSLRELFYEKLVNPLDFACEGKLPRNALSYYSREAEVKKAGKSLLYEVLIKFFTKKNMPDANDAKTLYSSLKEFMEKNTSIFDASDFEKVRISKNIHPTLDNALPADVMSFDEDAFVRRAEFQSTISSLKSHSLFGSSSQDLDSPGTNIGEQKRHAL